MLTPLSGKQGYVNTLLVVSRGYGNILYSRDMEQRSWASLCARPVKPGSADIGNMFPHSLLTASKMIQEVVATALYSMWQGYRQCLCAGLRLHPKPGSSGIG